MKLGYGEHYIDFEPDNSCQVILPNELPDAGEGEIERALNEPIGKDLSEFAGFVSATILVSDLTRPVPSYKIIPPLIEKLSDLEIREVKLIFGLGLHRQMMPKEERRLIGNHINVPHIQHDRDRCVNLGNTFRGTPVEVFEEALSSDLLIATGNIEYHYYAGYTGGAKAVLPGISSERSIIKNHGLMKDPRSVSGNTYSPVRQDMEEAAKISGLDFILNVVLNSKKEVVKAVAGDFVQAHRAGTKIVDRMYKKEIEPADIVLTCAGGSPKDINLFQAHKALENAKNAVKPGGTIILLAECREGLGNPIFEKWVKEAACAEDCIKRFEQKFEFGGHKAALLAKESLDFHLILVSRMKKEVTEMCFFEHATGLNRAISMAKDRHGNNAKMTIMPHGSLNLAFSEKK